MKNNNEQSWSEMWTRPTLTTFGNIFEGNYEGPILEFWQSQITGDIDHVVDLACGNGALTWIANTLLNAEKSKTQITGVDYAHIDPFKVLNKAPQDYPAIKFIGCTSIEKLPFEDNSVDLIISQYGLEYSNLEKSIPEAARVLSKTGRMAFIVHDINGEMAQAAIKTIDDYKMINDIIKCDELILQLQGLHEQNLNMRTIKKSEGYQALSSKIRTNLNIIQKITNRYPGDSTLYEQNRILNEAFIEAQSLSSKSRPNIKNTLDAARFTFARTIERKEELIAASLSKKQRKHLISLIKKSGFKITQNRIMEQKPGSNWGTIITAERKSLTPGPLGILKKILPG